MPYRSYGSRRQGQRRNTTRRPRRRTSLRSKARWQAPTARNQKHQIRQLANIALRNQRLLRAQRTFCDWKLEGSNSFAQAQFVIDLMSPNAWSATMRQNLDVVTQQRTYIRNMSFSWYLDGSALANEAQVTIFLVSIRPTAADWDGALVNDTTFCTQGEKNAVMLNSNVFKVHWTRQFQVFPQQEDLASGGAAPAGNPNTQYRRGRINIKSGYSIMAPAAQTWKQLTSVQLPPHRRLYILVFPQTVNPQSTTMTLNWGLKATTLNQD